MPKGSPLKIAKPGEAQACLSKTAQHYLTTYSKDWPILTAHKIKR
jgi:hypothetical protein